MLWPLLKRLKNRGVAAAPAIDPGPHLPEILQLGEGDPRMIVPAGADGYALLVNSRQGTVITNRYDAGVGWQLRTYGAYDAAQMALLERLARACAPNGVVLDVGANIGITALTFARALGPAGVVHAFEPQRVIFHMLAGNMALSSIDNVHCHYQALGQAVGHANIPRLDYRTMANFGGLELNRSQQSDLGQQAADGIFDQVPMTSIDALAFERVDLIKIDVEGMEADVLAGAMSTIRTQRPLMYIEYKKSDQAMLHTLLSNASYALFDAGDVLCVPVDHPRLADLAQGLPAWQGGA